MINDADVHLMDVQNFTIGGHTVTLELTDAYDGNQSRFGDVKITIGAMRPGRLPEDRPVRATPEEILFIHQQLTGFLAGNVNYAYPAIAHPAQTPDEQAYESHVYVMEPLDEEGPERQERVVGPRMKAEIANCALALQSATKTRSLGELMHLTSGSSRFMANQQKQPNLLRKAEQEAECFRSDAMDKLQETVTDTLKLVCAKWEVTLEEDTATKLTAAIAARLRRERGQQAVFDSLNHAVGNTLLDANLPYDVIQPVGVEIAARLLETVQDLRADLLLGGRQHH